MPVPFVLQGNKPVIAGAVCPLKEKKNVLEMKQEKSRLKKQTNKKKLNKAMWACSAWWGAAFLL